MLIVNKESIIPELITTPILDTTNPKVMKTKGEKIITARSQGDENLSSLPAQIALMEFADKATRTATMM